jgi:sulfofructose kinase
MENSLQIVGLGLATLDVLVRLKDMPTWERGARLNGFRFDGGGWVGTAMVAAAKLGARVGYIGTAGTDEAAELKLRSMVECGVDLNHLVRRPGPEDQIALVHVHAETGERVFSVMQAGPRYPLHVGEIDRDYIAAAEYLLLDGFHPEAALQAAKWMREAGKTVIMDAGKPDIGMNAQRHALIPYLDVLITGEGFASALTGIDEIWGAGATIIEMGPKIYVETVGERGSYTITEQEQFHTPAFQVDVVDTTGAGDVFHGAYIVGLIRRWSLQQIALFAAAVSALKCTRLGGRAGIPTFQETMAFLQERDIELG